MPTQETSIFTIRMPVDLQHKLDRLAQIMDRSRSWVVNNLLEKHVDEEALFLQKVQHGIDAADRDEFATDEAVDAVFRKFGVEE